MKFKLDENFPSLLIFAQHHSIDKQLLIVEVGRIRIHQNPE